MANTEALRNTGKFIEFVRDIKSKFPSQDSSLTASLFPESIASLWNRLGKNYLHQESIDALAATMYLLQEQGVNQVSGNKNKWLSIGSGPGLYELFLVKQLNRVKIDSLDISMEQLRVGKQIINPLAADNSKRINLINASMSEIPLASGKYDRVLVLNSLHWSADWKKAVSEVGRVLNPKNGSRVYAVIGSAAIVTKNGKTSPAKDLNTDTLIDEFEANGLMAKHLITMNILNGQLNMPTSRMFAVFERGIKPNKHWSERMISGQVKYGEITILPNGTFQRTKLNG